jgi:hypothetical protein
VLKVSSVPALVVAQKTLSHGWPQTADSKGVGFADIAAHNQMFMGKQHVVRDSPMTCRCA